MTLKENLKIFAQTADEEIDDERLKITTENTRKQVDTNGLV